MTLKDIKIGKSAVVTAVGGEGALRQHFLDMGVIPGAEVTVVKYAPMGDPIELRIHGYELTLRLADAQKIEVKAIDAPKEHLDSTLRFSFSVHTTKEEIDYCIEVLKGLLPMLRRYARH